MKLFRLSCFCSTEACILWDSFCRGKPIILRGPQIFLSPILREAGLPTSRNQAPPGTLVVYNGHIKSETLREMEKLRHPEAYKMGDDSTELQPAIRANTLCMHKIVHKIKNTNTGKHMSWLTILLLLFHFQQQTPKMNLALTTSRRLFHKNPCLTIETGRTLDCFYLDFLVLGVGLNGLQIQFSSQDILKSILSHCFKTFDPGNLFWDFCHCSSVADPDPRVFGSPGSGSGSIIHRYGSGSGSFYH